MNLKKKVWDKPYWIAEDQLRDQIYNQIWSKVREQVYNRIWRDVWWGFQEQVRHKLLQNIEGDL